MRPAPGKSNCILLDHSGAVFQHGLPEDPVLWTLSEDKTARNAKHESRKGDTFGGPTLIECKECHSLREGGKACPCCGFLPQRKPEIIVPRPGDLALVEGRRPGVANLDKDEWFGMFLGIVEERNQKPGRARHLFKDRFGHWPAWGYNPPPIPPNAEVRSYVRSRDIAFAKSRGPRP